MIKPEPTISTSGPAGLIFPAAWILVASFLFAGTGAATNAWAEDAVTLEIQSDAAYTLGPGDSPSTARELALFRAKAKAAYQAADRFEGQKLIQFVDHDKNELVHLVADRLQADEILYQYGSKGRAVICTVQTRATVRLSDFIEAQLTSLRLEKAEDEDNYRHEMEPPLPSPLQPGGALAKVYRLIDKQELRMAIIYLNRLAEGYPNWREIYELKAVTLRLEGRPVRMLAALRRACQLGSREACTQLK